METTAKDRALEKCAAAAVKAGCPYDQTEQFLEHSYVPYPWQWRFHAAARAADEPDGPTDIGLGGARGPGKSHAVISQAGIDDCLRVEGLKGLFLRQTGTSAVESFDDLINKALKGRVAYRKSKNRIIFTDTGSRIILGGFKDENDIDKYIGVEYDFIIIEELTQLTKEKYDKLKGSLRTSKPNWRPRIYSSFNPGGVGHAWVREMFVLPARANPKEASYLYIEPTTKKPIRVSFIPSTYKENPALNPEYITYLESLGGDLGKAWREGEWDLFAGQYFSEWRYEKHVVRPFAIPLSWKRFRSIDPSGRDGITSCHWYALDSDGRVWCYREYYYGVGVLDKNGNTIQIGRDYDQHALEIARLSADDDGVPEDYLYTIIDTAAFAKAGFSETAAEIYERHGVTNLLPAAKERVVGWNAVHYYLRHDAIHRRPLLQIFDTCANIIRTIPLLQHDEKRPEDVDSRGEDHAADELRYILRTFREAKAPRPLTKVEQRIQEQKALDIKNDYKYTR